MVILFRKYLHFEKFERGTFDIISLTAKIYFICLNRWYTSFRLTLNNLLWVFLYNSIHLVSVKIDVAKRMIIAGIMLHHHKAAG